MNEKPKILIVDDNISNIYVIEELLSEMDVDMIRATSGKEALEITAVNDLALVLMDVQMPGMDGFETVEMIRKNLRNQFLNIIYITAVCDDSTYRARGIRTGAVDFLTKPLVPDIFIGKVNVFLNLYIQHKRLEEEIRKRMETEAELIRSKEVAEEAAMMKQQFLSNMSHEIRTPLNAVVNSMSLLLTGNPRPDQMENLEILQFSAESLLHLINGILDFSRIDAGKIEFESIPFGIRRILDGIRRSFEPEILKKDLVMEVSAGKDVPEFVKGDPGRLSQILFNLVGNAIKFTEKGSVTVNVDTVSQDAEETELVFRVQDTGIGIPADKQMNIFEVFTQAASSTARKYGGTGLGLAITRMLVELQGGRIELNSEPGLGSTFSFILKFTKTSADDPGLNSHVPAFRDLSGLRILVVEDNLLNQKIVTKLLSAWNAVSDLAVNGQEALEKVKEEHYHLVLMDLQMPVMDGYEAATLIRSMNGDYFRCLPILAFTASAFMEDRSRIYTHGMNGYIIKPFSPEELNRKISGFCLDKSPLN